MILYSLHVDDSLLVLFVKCSLIGSMIASWNGIFLAEVTRVACSGDVGESTAASTFFTFLSYMVAPLVFGFVSFYFSYYYAFALMGCLVILSALFLLKSIFDSSREKE